ncbi:DUF6491 family protein [soil metagenome]
MQPKMKARSNAAVRSGRRLSTLACLLALAGCASGTGLREDAKLALYRSHAGAPVDHFRYHGRINGWTPLGDGAIALWTRPGEAWLLDLHGPCPDIAYAPAISVSHQNGRVSARFDRVLARGGGATDIPCFIREIRPLDVKAILQAERTAPDQSPDSGT